MPAADLRTIKTIEAEIESARCVYFVASADATCKATDRVASVAVANKALAAGLVYGGSMTAYAVANIEAAESFAVYYAALEAHQVATFRLQTLRNELASRLRTHRSELAILRAR